MTESINVSSKSCPKQARFLFCEQPLKLNDAEFDPNEALDVNEHDLVDIEIKHWCYLWHYNLDNVA